MYRLPLRLLESHNNSIDYFAKLREMGPQALGRRFKAKPADKKFAPERLNTSSALIKRI